MENPRKLRNLFKEQINHFNKVIDFIDTRHKTPETEVLRNETVNEKIKTMIQLAEQDEKQIDFYVDEINEGNFDFEDAVKEKILDKYDAGWKETPRGQVLYVDDKPRTDLEDEIDLMLDHSTSSEVADELDEIWDSSVALNEEGDEPND